MTNSPDPDLERLDELGIRVVAQALNLSSEAVRKWRVRGAIPDNRRNELRRLVANQSEEVGNLSSPDCQQDRATDPTEPSCSSKRLPMVVENLSICGANEIDLSRIAGPEAQMKVEEAMAERAAQKSANAAHHAADEVPRGGTEPPIRWYRLRLFGLFLLEFPVLTMVFVPVAKVAPIVAAGSAAALALFLVLGAHAIGAPLRHLANRLQPVWLDGLAVLLMASFLGTVVWIILALRIEGLVQDALGSAADSVFGIHEEPKDSAQFKNLIALAAALVSKRFADPLLPC